MDLRRKNRKEIVFNSSSMSDLVFLLLIFFMLTSTMIAPNAVKLLLPSSTSVTRATPVKVTVYITENLSISVDNDQPIFEDELKEILSRKLAQTDEGSVVLRCNFDVPVQSIVNVIDIVHEINDSQVGAKHKVILATNAK